MSWLLVCLLLGIAVTLNMKSVCECKAIEVRYRTRIIHLQRAWCISIMYPSLKINHIWTVCMIFFHFYCLFHKKMIFSFEMFDFLSLPIKAYIGAIARGMYWFSVSTHWSFDILIYIYIYLYISRYQAFNSLAWMYDVCSSIEWIEKIC